MTNHRHEHLSDLTDDYEVSSERVDALLDCEEQRATWLRYHIVRAAMRGESHNGPVDISASIAEMVAQEPVILAPNATRKNRVAWTQWMKPAANVAVAASVALITVIGVMQYQSVDDRTIPSNSNAQPMNTPVLQTMPLSGTVNPVSYNGAIPQESSYSEQDIERMRMRMQIQSFLQNHQVQVQSQQGVSQASQEVKADEESSDDEVVNQ